MCFGGKSRKSITGMQAPPAIIPRIEDDSTLPTKKELVDDDTKADVTFGSAKKKTAGAGNRMGAAALKIPLNTGTKKGANTGGLNV